MTNVVQIKEALNELDNKWERVTDIPIPPSTVLDIIEYSLSEQQKIELYLNRLFRYFLDPQEPHGMGSDFLTAFLQNIQDRCGFDEDLYDLSNAVVEDQVNVSFESSEVNRKGDVDLLLSILEKWFVMIELKLSASEGNRSGDGLSQTEFYYQADQVRGSSKEDFQSGRYYLYLHNSDSKSAKENEFSNLTWKEFVNGFLNGFITSNAVRYPQRTVSQLREFRDILKEVADMSKHKQAMKEKAELYIEHYESISDVTNAFEEEWEQFRWAPLMKERMDNRSLNFQWKFNSDEKWSYVYKKGWWITEDDYTDIDNRTMDEALKIGFHHHPENNRESILSSRKMNFYFRLLGQNPNDFRKLFRDKFREAENESIIRDLLPDRSEITGYQSNLVKAEYPVDLNDEKNIFEAYVETLDKAMKEHAFENQELVEEIDRIFHQAVKEYQSS